MTCLEYLRKFCEIEKHRNFCFSFIGFDSDELEYNPTYCKFLACHVLAEWYTRSAICANDSDIRIFDSTYNKIFNKLSQDPEEFKRILELCYSEEWRDIGRKGSRYAY